MGRRPVTSVARSMRAVPIAPAVALRNPESEPRVKPPDEISIPAKVEVADVFTLVTSTPPEKVEVELSPLIVVVLVRPMVRKSRVESWVEEARVKFQSPVMDCVAEREAGPLR